MVQPRCKILSMLPTPPSDEWIAEEAIARLLNVPRDIMRAQRPHLPAGNVRSKGNTVEWQKNAAREVATRLNLPWPSSTPAAAAPVDNVEELTVITQAVNPNIVNARRSNGATVCVRVVDNKKYLPLGSDGQPMKLRAKPSGVGAWWTLVGREPRWPGRW